MARDAIRMHLTAAERRLLCFATACPFSQSEAALKACAASHDIERVPIDCFDLKQLIGNLCYSINQTKPGPLQDEILEFCNRLEAAERYGDGELDVL